MKKKAIIIILVAFFFGLIFSIYMKIGNSGSNKSSNKDSDKSDLIVNKNMNSSDIEEVAGKSDIKDSEVNVHLSEKDVVVTNKKTIDINKSKYKIIDLIIGNSKFQTEVADTSELQRQGLSNRSSIDEDKAMLFMFDKSAVYSFWMKDMNFAIDMIWINDQKKIVHIERAIKPDTYPQTFQSKVPAKYVLEVQEGLSDKFGFKVGDTVNW